MKTAIYTNVLLRGQSLSGDWCGVTIIVDRKINVFTDVGVGIRTGTLYKG